jgi:hypothetical protein
MSCVSEQALRVVENLTLPSVLSLSVSLSDTYIDTYMYALIMRPRFFKYSSFILRVIGYSAKQNSLMFAHIYIYAGCLCIRCHLFHLPCQ